MKKKEKNKGPRRRAMEYHERNFGWAVSHDQRCREAMILAAFEAGYRAGKKEAKP